MEITRAIYSDWMKDIQEEKIRQILARIKPIPSGKRIASASAGDLCSYFAMSHGLANAKPKILDAGSGAGFLERRCKGIYAIDIDLANLKKADGVKVLADGRKMPFKPRTFKMIFCLDAIHLLKDGRELERLLSEDGTLIVSTFCNEYNKKERLEWLKHIFRRLRIKSEFFVGSKEQDAVIFCVR